MGVKDNGAKENDLNKDFFSFELNGKPVLGADTGIDSASFARAGMARLIAKSGFIVYPDGKIEAWQPGGAVESVEAFPARPAVTMIVWGPFFPGESLLELVSDSERKDEALDAVRFWLKAATDITESSGGKFFPGPLGALIITAPKAASGNLSEKSKSATAYPAGTLFFPPAELLKHGIEGPSVITGSCWSHPDLQGSEGLSFCSAVMLYRIFCGVPAFPLDSGGEARQIIREESFTPPNLEAPGLAPEMSALVGGALSLKQQKEAKSARPEIIGSLLGPPASKCFSSWFKPLSNEELAKIRAEKAKCVKKKALAVKTGRFITRNSRMLTALGVAFVLLIAVAAGFISRRAEPPATLGMNPVEIAQTYYAAFGELDHILMSSCVSGEGGEADIQLAINLYVISRVRTAYEGHIEPFISINGLKITMLSIDSENANLEVDYLITMPSGEEGLPQTFANRDYITMIFQKDIWRIISIKRTSEIREP